VGEENEGSVISFHMEDLNITRINGTIQASQYLAIINQTHSHRVRTSSELQRRSTSQMLYTTSKREL
jgi:hypothetical protein